MKLAQKGKKWPKRSPEGELRRIEAVKLYAARPEVKTRLAEQASKIMSNPEARNRAAEKSRAYWSDPANREKHAKLMTEKFAARRLRNQKT